MAREKTMPFGVDIGLTRVRAALSVKASDGEVRLRAVASREIGANLPPNLVAALVEELVAELGTKERRCVAALGPPIAHMRVVRMPKMSWAERNRVARFEARRLCPWDVESETTRVRLHPVGEAGEFYALGMARYADVQERFAILRGAGLRPVAFDHDALALRRALPYGDAVIDIGAARTTLHAFGSAGGPQSLCAPVGGDTVTEGIAGDLGIEFAVAEKRKRILGSAGAGIVAKSDVVREISALVEKARARTAISRILLVGNGSKLPGMASDIECATGASVEMPVAEILRSDAYPDDVVRSAAPDWTLAAALATWNAAPA